MYRFRIGLSRPRYQWASQHPNQPTRRSLYMAIKSITTLVTTCPACGERAYDDGSCQVCGHSH